MVVLLDNGIAYSSSWSGENIIGEINYNGNELRVEKRYEQRPERGEECSVVRVRIVTFHILQRTHAFLSRL
jgi:hypothetical protein